MHRFYDLNTQRMAEAAYETRAMMLAPLGMMSSNNPTGVSNSWSLAASAKGTATSATITFPSVTSATTSNPQGFLGLAAFANSWSNGSTSGFTYSSDTGNHGGYCSNLGLASNTAYSPTASQGTSGDYSAISAIFEWTGSSIALATGSPVIGTYNQPPPTSITVNPQAAGDAVVVMGYMTGTEVITGLSGVCTNWANILNEAPGGGHYTSSMWWGTATASGSASITVTWTDTSNHGNVKVYILHGS